MRHKARPRARRHGRWAMNEYPNTSKVRAFFSPDDWPNVSTGSPMLTFVEASLFEHVLPARTGQPTRDSAGPEVDVA